MVGVIWYRFVRCGGTDWSDTLVPIRPLQWYRLKRYVGTDSSARVVPIRRYYHIRSLLRSKKRRHKSVTSFSVHTYALRLFQLLDTDITELHRRSMS